MIIIAVAFLGIVAFIGFAVDTGIMYLNRIWLGQAIDAAALAAGYELPDIEGSCSRAVEYLATNGYVEDDDFHFQIIFTEEDNAPGGPVGEFVLDSDADNLVQPSDCTSVSVPSEHVNTHFHVRIAGELTVPVVFMRVMGFDTVGVGIPATAKRTAQYDVALVLDTSGSMKFDTCHYFTDDPGSPYSEPYACENIHGPCSSAFSTVDFDGYADIDAMITDGWVINSTDAVELQLTNGRGGSKAVHIFEDPVLATEGSLSWNFDTTGREDIALYFWVKNDPAAALDSGDYARVSWRADSTSGWIPIMSVQGNFSTSYEQYAIMLDSDEAEDNPDLEIRFDVYSANGYEGFILDDIELKSCPFKRGPDSLWTNECNNSVTKDCLDDQLLPGNSYDALFLPRTYLLEQPMTDVIRGAEKFTQILAERADEAGLPREDQIGLAKFNTTASTVYALTIDYEALVDEMYNFQAEGYTNLGGGMRMGLSILSAGRPNSTHFMVLLTDGVLNRHDVPPYNCPGDCGYSCSGSSCEPYINAMIDRARAQNVTIFTIGLGNDVVNNYFYMYGDGSYTGMKLLQRIAMMTNGQSYHSPTTEELEQIFEWIAEAIFVRLTL